MVRVFKLDLITAGKQRIGDGTFALCEPRFINTPACAAERISMIIFGNSQIAFDRH